MGEQGRLQMAEIQNGKRSRLGFTMTETLAAVAILVALMAVMFPAVFSIQHSMRMMQLDAQAQAIYNSAQSRLAALTSTGQSYLLAADVTTEQGSKVLQMPADYPDKSANWDDYGLYQVSSSNGAVTDFLVTSESNPISTALTNGTFIIEFSPSTGEVYAVYYWESDAISPQGGAISYDAIKDLRTRDQRSPYYIGYYGGAALDKQPAAEDTPDQNLFSDLDVSLVNSEELYASVKSDSLGKLVGDSQQLASLKIKVDVEGLSATNWGKSTTWTHTYSPGFSTTSDSDNQSNLTLSSSDTEVDIILDSMRDNMSFADIVKGILPGSDITVTVSLYCNIGQSDPSAPLRTQQFTTNSLFEKVDKTNANSPTAYVSSVRHLRNLDSNAINAEYKAANNNTDISNMMYNLASYSNVAIDSDIDFDGTTWVQNPTCVSVQSRKVNPDNAASVDNGFNPLETFSPVTLSEKDKYAGTVQGNGHVLKNFSIQGTGDGGTGLIANLYRSVKSLNFENPRVVGDGDNIGTLAGLHTAGVVSGCHVYASDGLSDDQLSNIGVFDSAGDNVGGLVGKNTGNTTSGNTTSTDQSTGETIQTFDGCSSTITVEGRSYVGGIVGLNDAYATIANCSVGYKQNDLTKPLITKITSTEKYAGGITGATQSTISDARAYVDITGVESVGGLVGAITNWGSIDDSQVGNIGEELSSRITASGDYVGGLAGSLRGGGSKDSVLATVEGGSCVGGLVGELIGGDFTDSTVGCRSDLGYSNRESVTSMSDTVGGAFGQVDSGITISGITSSADVIGYGSNIGGLVGYCSGEVVNSAVHQNPRDDGTVDQLYVADYATGQRIGGLVGFKDSGSSISYSFAATNIICNSGSEFIGGLIGYASNGNVSQCYASGEISDGASNDLQYVGGLAGRRDGGTWDHIFTTVAVTGSTHVGGAFGYDNVSEWNTKYCYVLGKVQAGKNGVVAGISSNRSTYYNANGNEVWYLSYSNYNQGFKDSSNCSTDYASLQDKMRGYETYWGYWQPGAFVSSTPTTYLFSLALVGKGFPFGVITYNNAILPYYGDWPAS